MAETANIPIHDDLFFQTLVGSYVTNPRFLRRGWLADEVDERLADLDSRFVLLIAEPGAGKSTFMAQLAAGHDNWPRYFIRRDQRTPLGDVSAHSFLLRIGYQLSVAYPDLFQQDLVKIGVEQRIGSVEDGGVLLGAEIKRVLASPFHQKVLEIHQNVTGSKGKIVGLRIDELVLDPSLLQTAELANMALFDPAWALFKLDPQQKIVILVDALDEIRYHQTPNNILQWLINAPDLPPNLRFILSSRPPDAGLQLFCEKQAMSLRRLPIEPLDEHVQADVKRYIERLTAEPELAAALAEQVSRDGDFGARLAIKAHGNMGYVDSVARAIDNATTHKDRTLLAALINLQDLPDDLESLYAFFLHQIKAGVASEVIELSDNETGEFIQKKIWPAIFARTLGVLAVAMEPLSLPHIRDLGGIAADWEYITDAVERLRPFLDIITNRYRLYHSTVAEFLTADSTRDRPETSDLYIDPKNMHKRISAHYLRAWGGLEAGLPGILDISSSSTDGGYGLRHLVGHLEAGDQRNLIHRLLGLSTREGRNVWYKAKASGGDIAGYRADILRAWRLAKEDSYIHVQRGEPALSISQELRYALVIATLSSLANNIPPNLLSGMVKAGSWSCEEGLAFARQIPDLVQRAEALADLAEVCASYKERAFREAVATADRIEDIYWREATVALLATRLPVELSKEFQFNESKDVSTLLLDYSGSGKSAERKELPSWDAGPEELSKWLALADELPETQRVELLLGILPGLEGSQLQSAFTVAKSIREEFKRTIAITGLVRRMVETGETDRAKEAAREIAFLHNRAQALSRFVNLPSDFEKPIDISDNLTRARSISEPHWRAAALAAIAALHSVRERQHVLDEAWSAAQSINDGEQGTEILVRAAVWLGELGRPDQALAIINNISDMYWRSLGLVALAHLLPDDSLSEALSLAREITDPCGRSWSIAALGARINTLDQAYVLEEIIAEVRSIPDEKLLVTSVLGLASFLSESQFEEIVREAFEVILSSQREHELAEGIARLASCLPEPNIRQALDAARQIKGEKSRSIALSSISISLAQHGFTDEAFELAVEQVVDEYLRQEALYSIAEFAVDSNKIALARSAIDLLKYEHWQARSFVRLAAGCRASQVAEILEKARQIKEPRWRAKALSGLHTYLPAKLHLSILKEALAAVQLIVDENELGKTLYDMASVLPISLVNQALKLAVDMTRQREKGEASAGLIISMAQGGQVEAAFEKAREIAEPYWQAMTFIHLSTLISDSQRQELNTGFQNALEKITDLDDGLRLGSELSLHIGDFPPLLIYSFWSFILALASSYERERLFRALSDLFPILTYLGGLPLIEATANSVREISQWWPWSEL